MSCPPDGLDRCVFRPCSLSPLREPSNLTGNFARCELFPVVRRFRVDLVRFCQALRFSNVHLLQDLLVLFLGLRSPSASLLPSFP